jgi:4-oxalocrotonate tautomerase
MPIVTINMLKRKDKNKKKELIKNVTDAVTETLEIPAETVRVILNEMEDEHYGIAGLPVREFRLKKNREQENRKKD